MFITYSNTYCSPCLVHIAYSVGCQKSRGRGGHIRWEVQKLRTPKHRGTWCGLYVREKHEVKLLSIQIQAWCGLSTCTTRDKRCSTHLALWLLKRQCGLRRPTPGLHKSWWRMQAQPRGVPPDTTGPLSKSSRPPNMTSSSGCSRTAGCHWPSAL